MRKPFWKTYCESHFVLNWPITKFKVILAKPLTIALCYFPPDEKVFELIIFSNKLTVLS